jgi:RNA polymerase sigma factor (sigma-70 family)
VSGHDPKAEGSGRPFPADRWSGPGERQLLLNLAYRLLGSVAEAEDAVQESYLRWHLLPSEQQSAIASPAAWLTKVTSRICLDELRSARARRETYVGEWLPDPLPDRFLWGSPGAAIPAVDPADRVARQESLSMAVLVVLESMTPAERVAFVLHDVFRFSFAEIAEVLGRSPQAARKLASSGRARLRSSPLSSAPAAGRVQAVRAFQKAWASADFDAMVRILDPSVTAVIDGGGLVSAALHPLEGAVAVAQFFAGIHQRQPDLTVLDTVVNGEPGLLARTDATVLAVLAFECDGSGITRVWAVRNPLKLGPWATARPS